jgi:hypothetical protein
MRLLKWLIGIAFVVLIITLFMENKDVELQINYFGLAQPLKVAFWVLVTFCVSLGIIIAALGDFITQVKWIREKRRMIKTDREHKGEVGRLNEKIGALEAENQTLKQNLDRKSREASDMQKKLDALSAETEEASQSSLDQAPPVTEGK